MANVIQLTDNYVATSSVYDTNQNKTQADINSSVSSSITTINSNFSALNAFPKSVVQASTFVDLGKSWNGTSKTYTLTVPEAGLYLINMWFHICGSNSLPAGSSVLIQGGIFESYLGYVVPLTRDWDKYNNAVAVSYLSSGSKTITVSGTFQNGTSDNTYGSSGSIFIYKIAN